MPLKQKSILQINKSFFDPLNKAMSSNQAVKIVQVVRCPYNQLHIMPRDSFPRHLEKCKSNNKDEFRQCPFNIFHVMRKELFEQHIKNCTSKNNLEDLYDDEWSEEDNQMLQVQDWGVQETWDNHTQGQKQPVKQTIPQAIKHERNILTESIVRPIMLRGENQTSTPTDQIAQRLRNLIINCDQDRQSQSYWLPNGGNDNNNALKTRQIKGQKAQQQKISQVRDKQKELLNPCVNKSRVFTQSCIVNREFENQDVKKMLEMSFFQGMKPVNNHGLQNNNQSFIIDYSISQVHNYNHPYPPPYPSHYPQGFHINNDYPGAYMHPHMQYPYPPMTHGHFPAQFQSPYDKKEEQKKMKKTKHKEQRSKEKGKKQKKDKKKSKKSDH